MNKLEDIIKRLHETRRYLEDKEWLDKEASAHVDTIIEVISILKEQENLSEEFNKSVELCRKYMEKCGVIKCSCYHENDYGKPRCWGTKEREECTCNGDRTKCNFPT